MLNPLSHNVDRDVVGIESFTQEFDKIQLNLLIGLRVVEHLGRRYSSTHATYYKRDDELVEILNWIALFIAPNCTDTYCDIAVAFSAEQGTVTIHIANSSGGTPNEVEHANLSLLLSILRRAFCDDNDPALTASSFLVPLVQKSFPEILRKLASVRNAETDGPHRTLHRFCNLVSFWVRYRPGGECSRGFVDMAVASGKRTTDMLVQSFMHLMMIQDFKEQKGTASNEKYAYLEPVFTLCDLLVRSTFFDDLVNHFQYRLALDISDLLFLHELLRELYRVASYKRGSTEFAYRGVSYLKQVLGYDGVAKFMRNAGGIVVNWVTSSGFEALPKTYRWPISPRESVAAIIERDSLDLDDLDFEMREYVVQTEAVNNAWKEGDSITPQLHCELRLIRYIEEQSIGVVDRAIGTSQPTCWACYCYIKKLKSVPSWSMSCTSGKARDDWLLPPDGSDVGRTVLRALDKLMERVVEEYAFECCP